MTIETLFSENFIPWLTTSGISIGIIILITVIIRLISKTTITNIVRRAVPGSAYSSEEAEIKREETLIQILHSTLGVVIWIISLLLILGQFNVNLGPLLAGAGIMGVALGFGAQYLVRDMINGFFIVLENQYRVGDMVTIGANTGTVEKVSLRTTIIRDLDGAVHHIPNGEIKHVANRSKDFSRINLNLHLDHKTDIDKLAEVINHVGETMMTDPDWKELIQKAPQFIRVNDLTDSALVIRISGETKPLAQWSVMGELRRRLKMAFDENNFSMAVPQRIIHNKKN